MYLINVVIHMVWCMTGLGGHSSSRQWFRALGNVCYVWFIWCMVCTIPYCGAGIYITPIRPGYHDVFRSVIISPAVWGLVQYHAIKWWLVPYQCVVWYCSIPNESFHNAGGRLTYLESSTKLAVISCDIMLTVSRDLYRGRVSMLEILLHYILTLM